MSQLYTKLYEYTAMYSKQRTSMILGALFQDVTKNRSFLGCLDDLELCPAEDDHIDPIDALMQRINSRKNVDIPNGVLYLTYPINTSTANKIIENGFKSVVYANLYDINPKTIETLNNNGITVARFDSDIMHQTYDNTKDEWWTDKFYNSAYDVVKDRKAPFTIISYNNPTVPTLKNFKVDQMTEDCNWPFIVFVRDSQKQMYEEQLAKYKYVSVVSFPDETISNAGAVRRASQKWLYDQGYTIALQSDDDCNLLTYSRPGYQGNGLPKAQYVDNTNICKIIAMWQLAMEEAIERDNVYLSCSMPVGFSWKADYCMSHCSYLVSRGSFTNIICWNLKGLVEDGIFYRDNPEVGLDDIDMEIRVVASGHNVCNFVWLANGGDAMSSGSSLEILQQRFKECQDKLRSFHGELPWVKFRVKRGLDQVCVDFPAVRRWQVEQGIRNTPEYIYDIWNDGLLLKR